MLPLISIVITTYNYAEYLARCIDSVVSQTYKNYELIIVNDGSTDDTNDVIAPYLKRSNIKYIEQNNAGQAVAKNTGIRQCSGDLIAFLDADDSWMPDKLEKQLALLLTNEEIGVVYTRAKWVDENDQDISVNAVKASSGWVTNKFVIDNFVHFSSALVKKECLDRVGNFDESLEMSIDWDLWLRISKYYQFAYVNEQLIAYRVGHPGQMSHKQEKRQQQSDYVLERFIDRNPGLIPGNVLTKAKAYTYRNRGDYYSSIDKNKALKYNIKSLLINPLQPRIYARILRLLLKSNADAHSG